MSGQLIRIYGVNALSIVPASVGMYGVPSRSVQSVKVIVKKIEAIFPPFKLDNVRNVLIEHSVYEFVVTEINTHEVERAPAERWSRQSLADLIPELNLELAINDDNARAVAYAILRAAQTRRPDDTKVTIIPVEQLVEIETGDQHG